VEEGKAAPSKDEDAGQESPHKGEADAPPVDGPSAGEEGQEDAGDLGSTSQDRPGSHGHR
jgi:hypothetical protein